MLTKENQEAKEQLRILETKNNDLLELTKQYKSLSARYGSLTQEYNEQLENLSSFIEPNDFKNPLTASILDLDLGVFLDDSQKLQEELDDEQSSLNASYEDFFTSEFVKVY